METIGFINSINWVTLVVIGIIVFFTWSGYKRGFVKLLVSLASMGITFILVWTVTPYISDYLMNNTGVYQHVKGTIDEAFEERNSERDNTVLENQVETINSYSVPGMMKKLLLNNNTPDVYNSLTVTIFEDYVSSFLARLIVKIMAFISSYIMIMLLLKMTFLSMHMITKIPGISGLNRFVGLCFGMLEGLFLVWMGFIVAMFFWGNKFYTMVYSDPFLRMIYEKNVILSILTS